MRCKCKLFSVSGIPASDGSIIPRDVVETYLNSEDYRNAIESKKMLGSLTHRARNLANAPQTAGTALTKTIGKDDMMLLVGVSSPTHYVERLYIENDGWCYADIKILEETGLDDEAIQYIRRLKGLLSQGIHPGVSAVIVAYWDSTSTGSDICRKIQSIKSLDVTLNPSWKAAQIVKIDDEKGDSEKTFSAKDYQFDGLKVKQFSDLNSIGCGDLIKSSKINGVFTKLKAKQFSASGVVEEVDDISTTTTKEKTFSAASLRVRIKEGMMSPRMRFRRLILDYRQLIRQLGGAEKVDAATMKSMKSLFTSDVLDIMKQITPEIMSGKQINTLIGASSLGKSVRVAAQKLQMPFRMAMQESAKQGFVSKMRYQAIQDAYIEFINSLMDDIFGSTPGQVTSIGEDANKGGDNFGKDKDGNEMIFK